MQIFSRYGRKCKQIAFYLFSFAINLWHGKFVTADVSAVFVNNQHGIQGR